MKIKWEDFKNKAEAIQYLKKSLPDLCPTTRAAEQYLRSHMPKESYYQSAVIAQIKKNAPDSFTWKAAAGAYGVAGIPDVLTVIDGRLWAFEVKRPLLGKLSKRQGVVIAEMRHAGANVYVVTCADDVDKIFKNQKCEKTN